MEIYIFPFDLVKEGRKVIIYGCGNAPLCSRVQRYQY